MRLPSLNALRAFEAAARLQSLSQAGDELHVTHAAISHQVRKLEDWFGLPLLRRVGRGIEPTAAGQILQAQLTATWQQLADTCQTVKAYNAPHRLKVGCIPSIASRWLVPRLAQFSKRHPDADIRVEYASANAQLLDGTLDVLITLGQDSSLGVRSHMLFSRINLPVCSPHFVKRNSGLKRPETLVRASLLHDESRDGWREWCERAGLTGLKRPRSLSGPIFQDFNMLATAVIAGHGIGLCPVNVFRAEIERGDLVVLSDIATNEDKGYYMMWRDTAGPLVTQFVQWFARQTKQGSLPPKASRIGGDSL